MGAARPQPRGKTPQVGRTSRSGVVRAWHPHRGSSLDEFLDFEGVRAQLDRLLDPQRDVTLSTLSRAATALGRQLRVMLA